MSKEINLILPSNNDGGGNRWSYLLASNLSKIDKNLKINFLYPEFSYFSNIYTLNNNVKKIPYKTNRKNKFISLFLFFLFLKKNIKKDTVIIVSDPILSILMFFFKKNIVFRNVASDDYNLYNYSRYRYFGLTFIYKILTYFSFLYKNVNYIFNSQYTYSQIYKNSKIPFFLNNIDNKIIFPMLGNDYLESNLSNDHKRENSIVIFPRKHNNKGFDKFHELKNTEEFRNLKIDNIYLVINKNEYVKYTSDKDYTVINPKSDKDIINILNKSICFLSTSESEGFGLPPLEAMSRGCCPIIVDAGGTSSYCFNGYNSLVSNKNNQKVLLKNIKLLIKDKNFRLKLSKNGLDTAKKFSQENISSAWYNLIINYNVNSENKNKQNLINYVRDKINYLIFVFKNCDQKLKKNIFSELLLFPFLIFVNFLQILLSKIFNSQIYENIKRKENTNKIKICLQDWSEYEDLRYKELKNGFVYRCGLEYQYNKLKSNKYLTEKFLYISVNDKNNLDKSNLNIKKLENFKKNDFEINIVNNEYLDFSSYADFYYKKVEKNKNDILLFMNSSVSTEFNEPIIDNYIDYFNKNKDVGILGISANSSKYQSLIGINFNPHIQSLFFITTTDIMKKVINKNKNIFPGLNSSKNNKYSLIINGEIKLSKIIMELGYNIAVVNNYGEVKKFNFNYFFMNRQRWPMSKRDSRLNSNYPSQTSLII